MCIKSSKPRGIFWFIFSKSDCRDVVDCNSEKNENIKGKEFL
jgi:hypothetical protein